MHVMMIKRAAPSGLTRSLVVPTTTLLAAPGRGGKLERPSSKLGDGGLGGGGGD